MRNHVMTSDAFFGAAKARLRGSTLACIPEMV
jgi:hypothetical protein